MAAKSAVLQQQSIGEVWVQLDNRKATREEAVVTTLPQGLATVLGIQNNINVHIQHQLGIPANTTVQSPLHSPHPQHFYVFCSCVTRTASKSNAIIRRGYFWSCHM
jgi:hypothetical protein